MQKRRFTLGTLLVIAGAVTSYGTLLQAANHRPVAIRKSVITAEDTTVTFLLNGKDSEGDALSFHIVARPKHGKLTRLRGPRRVNSKLWNTKWRYTPNHNFNGEDHLRFKVNDGNLNSFPKKVTLTVTAVNDRPVAIKKYVVAQANTPQTFLLKGKDVDGDALTFRLATRPEHGTLKRIRGPRRENAKLWDSKWRYIPDTDFSGKDFFRFKVNDGTLASRARDVKITVKSGWGTPRLIETNDDGNAEDPQVAVDAVGNAIAVWSQLDDNDRWNIWANHYSPKSGWGTAEMIETNDDGDARHPQVAIDTDGNAIAVWNQSDGNHNFIWSNRYEAGTGWGVAEKIETSDYGDAGACHIAVDPDGNAVAVWERGYGAHWHVYANRYTPGNGWGTAQMIETGNDENAREPQVAVDAEGNAIAVWHQYNGDGWISITANRYVPGVGWGTAELIEINDSGHAGAPQIAFDADGNAIVVWDQSYYKGSTSIWFNRYEAGSGWGTAGMIESSDEEAYDPQLGVDPEGNATAVWRQWDGSHYNIWANHYVPESGWGTANLIETSDEGDARYPQVAVDPNGRAVAVWSQYDGDDYHIFSNRYVPGIGWKTANIIRPKGGDSHDPQVAIDAKGHAITVWQQWDGPYDIWSSRYTPSSSDR